MELIRSEKSRSWVKNLFLASLSAIILLAILAKIPVSVDYQHFMLATRGWLSDLTPLYDAKAGEFYYLPWALWITVPLSLLPDWLGQAVLNLISLTSIAWVCRMWTGKLKAWEWFLVLANLFTINLLFTAQWDGLILLGIGLAWWALQKRRAWLFGLGLLLAATKPVNVILPFLLLSWYALRTFERKMLFQMLISPLILILWSVWACGLDWPLRFLQYIVTDSPPSAYNSSLWKELPNSPFSVILLIGLSFFIILWIGLLNKKNMPLEAILFALTGNLTISPYVLTYHFIVTAPSLAWISKRNMVISLAIYGFMLWILLGVARILPLPPFILYPVIILAGQALLTALPMRQAFSSE